VLHKKYETPAGVIKVEVRQTRDWEGGDHIGLGSDFTVPASRSIRQHVGGRADLKSLRYLLAPPTADQVRSFRDECAARREFARDRGLLFSTPMETGSVIDAAIQIAGVEALIMAAIEDPGYLEEFFSIMWDRNMLRMEIILDEKPELFIRRGWYENMSFWSPDMFGRFMKPYIEKETRWAHDAGAKYAYINTCSYMPILDEIIGAGVDVLIGVDPVEDKRLDMAALKEKATGRLCLWGGGNGFVTVENGAPEQIRGEVRAAMDILAPGGGFILAPIDNVRELSDRAMENSKIFINAWKQMR
jgi:uroporphyrinogen decarboxylase